MGVGVGDQLVVERDDLLLVGGSCRLSSSSSCVASSSSSLAALFLFSRLPFPVLGGTWGAGLALPLTGAAGVGDCGTSLLVSLASWGEGIASPSSALVLVCVASGAKSTPLPLAAADHVAMLTPRSTGWLYPPNGGFIAPRMRLAQPRGWPGDPYLTLLLDGVAASMFFFFLPGRAHWHEDTEMIVCTWSPMDCRGSQG